MAEKHHESARGPHLSKVVGSAISQLHRAFTSDSIALQGKAKATLAHLRRAAGTPPQDDPLAWAAVLETMVPEFPATFHGRGDDPSREETAAFIAFTMYALHQQSHTDPMHRMGVDLGNAVGLLCHQHRHDGGASRVDSTKARFDAFLLSTTTRMRLYHLRNLISLLRSEGIAFDYGSLAADLRWINDKAAWKNVVLKWTRSFAIKLHHGDENTKKEKVS